MITLWKRDSRVPAPGARRKREAVAGFVHSAAGEDSTSSGAVDWTAD